VKLVQHPAAIVFLLICLPGMGTGGIMMAQEQGFRVIDHVDLPAELGGAGGTGLYLELRDNWTFYPGLPALRKETRSYLVRGAEEETRSPEELKQQLAGKIQQLPVSKGKPTLREVVYEFSLLDPHLEGSGLRGFPEPDSMDRSTRELQASLIALVRGRIRNIGRYNLEEQLLSVRFHETWRFDPSTLELVRQVDAITPVIWQRRRTGEGEPVNDAETGWPVYYKNILSTLSLRNP
jgi:hypothetical protein